MSLPNWREFVALVIKGSRVVDVIPKGNEVINYDGEQYVLKGYGFQRQVVDIYINPIELLNYPCSPQVEEALTKYKKGEVK